eukprot:1367559-Prymnesium_polylepis.1
MDVGIKEFECKHSIHHHRIIAKSSGHRCEIRETRDAQRPRNHGWLAEISEISEIGGHLGEGKITKSKSSSGAQLQRGRPNRPGGVVVG